ncbi:Fc.00g021620.m01.CDS01 [Cosmosporella sp. VM-42]
MRTRNDLHSTSSISLHDLDVSSRTSNSHSSSPNGDTQSWDGDQDQESAHSRGGGTAAPPGNNSGDGSGDTPEQASTWQKGTTYVAAFWKSNVSCEVEHSASRDHLALERTFLGYLRTSMMMSIIGTTIAQLFTINNHDAGFGYTLVGKPFAAVCYSFSIGTILLGALRCWRQQHAMICGQALSSGFEIHLIGVGAVLLLIVFFGFLIAIDAVKVSSPEADLESRIAPSG